MIAWFINILKTFIYCANTLTAQGKQKILFYCLYRNNNNAKKTNWYNRCYFYSKQFFFYVTIKQNKK